MSLRPPDFHHGDPWAAAKVGEFMAEASYGRWKVVRFNVNEEDVALNTYAAMHEGAPTSERRRAMQLRNVIPVGEYVSLKRHATTQEVEQKPELLHTRGGPWVPVMSDTPAEIGGHAHAIENATGRVLVHGLGLGCIVSALLAKDDVTFIDVVEIDPDVRALTGVYYKGDPRVGIRPGDALSYHWPANARWDYAWHDIWTHISSRNLNPDEAEHGITYQAMFDRFDGRARMQGAWAYEDALEMADVEREDREQAREWEDRFWAADEDERVEMVFDQHVRDQVLTPDGRRAFPEGTELPQEFTSFFEQHGLKDGIRQSLRRAMQERMRSREAFETYRNAPQPIGNPNEGLG